MVKTIKIPWAAWREPQYKELNFPDTWDVNFCRMDGADAPELSAEEIKDVILNPIGTLRLSDLAKGKETVAIAVDDMTRLTPVSKIIPIVLQELQTAGISDENITFILALGSHRPMNREDCVKKLGIEIVEKFNIQNHHPYENLTKLGESELGTPIEVNTTYYEADLKIALGGVIPHPLAGFGGGAKIILPGVSGINTLEANHSAAVRGVGIGIAKVTDLRLDIEEAAEKAGLDFSINVVFNEIGDMVAMTAGHYVDAHRKAMEKAKEIYSTEIETGNQICFFNAYPEDTELNQVYKGLNLMMTSPKSLLDRKGAIVLMGSIYEGRGYHSLLFETGSRLFMNFGDNIIWKALVKRRKLYIHSKNISYPDLYHLFPKSVKIFKDWDKLIEQLEKDYGDSPKAAVFASSIQIGK